MSHFDDILARQKSGLATVADLDKLVKLAEAVRYNVRHAELKENVARLEHDLAIWKNEAAKPTAIGRYAQAVGGIVRDTEAQLARATAMLKAWGDLFGETIG